MSGRAVWRADVNDRIAFQREVLDWLRRLGYEHPETAAIESVACDWTGAVEVQRFVKPLRRVPGTDEIATTVDAFAAWLRPPRRWSG